MKKNCYWLVVNDDRQPLLMNGGMITLFWYKRDAQAYLKKTGNPNKINGKRRMIVPAHFIMSRLEDLYEKQV